LGISRSALYYRRHAKAREQAALAQTAAVLDRLQWQLAELRESLDRCAAANAIMAAELGCLLSDQVAEEGNAKNYKPR
jgi:hypothetical protein